MGAIGCIYELGSQFILQRKARVEGKRDIEGGMGGGVDEKREETGRTSLSKLQTLRSRSISSHFSEREASNPSA